MTNQSPYGQYYKQYPSNAPRNVYPQQMGSQYGYRQFPQNQNYGYMPRASFENVTKHHHHYLLLFLIIFAVIIGSFTFFKYYGTIKTSLVGEDTAAPPQLPDFESESAISESGAGEFPLQEAPGSDSSESPPPGLI